MNATNFEKPFKRSHNIKFLCKFCKGDHLLRNCPSIPQLLEVWSTSSHQPLLSTSIDHTSDKPSTSDNKVPGEKGKVRFPCRLCEGILQTHVFLHMDDDSKLLENLVASQWQLPTGHHKIYPNPPLVDEVIDSTPYSFNPTLSTRESNEPFFDQQLVEKVVNSIPYSINCPLPFESDFHTTQALLVTWNPTEQGGNSPVLMKPPISNQVFAFDWNQLTNPCLPSYMPFQVMVKSCDNNIYHTIIDGCAFVRILSSTAWEALGSP